MKKSLLIVVVLLLIVFSCARVRAQGSTSNKGTEFWTCWMDHTDGTNSSMSLYITGDISTTATVSSADGSYSVSYPITANQVTIAPIPTSFFLSTGNKSSKGIHVTSLKNIVVYAHIFSNMRSGATLVLPVNAMGKDYYSINYTQKSSAGANNPSYSAFCVIGTENNTTVEITPTAALIDNHAANAMFTITLNKGDVYQGLSATDLTGTHIRSISSGTETCKKIALYSGSSWLYISCNGIGAKTSADNLFQQAYPTASWGKNYVTAPLSNRHYDVFRIVYSDPTAVVKLNGTTILPGQTNGLYYEFTSTTANVITADKPIQVAQYAVTQGSTLNCVAIANDKDVGDPEMIFLSPIEQGLDHVTLYSTSNQKILQSYINVIIPTSAAASFVVDGKSASFTPVAGTVNNTSYSYAQINVGTGTHTISASTPFNAIAYGFGDVESYGYSAGTDLKNLNEFIELKNPVTNTAGASGCLDVSYRPQITIPYQTTKISWDFKDNKPPVVDLNPVFISKVTKGNQTLYTYEYQTDVTYTAAGSYTMVATVLNPTADDCGSNEDIEFDYTISDIPKAQFITSVTNKGACPGDDVSFTDQTNTNGIATKTWSWDFGDKPNETPANLNTATNANPRHIYTKPGDYTITLTVENQNGCSTTATETIHVNKMPQAAFDIAPINCETQSILFTDASQANEGTITQWAWDFGDAANSTTTNPNTSTAQNPQHIFKTAGTYTVGLTVTSSTGCTNFITNQVIVHPQPQVDFTPPDVCISDAFAVFNNTSTIADGTEADFEYTWDFGDKNATAAANTSKAKSPKHTYTEANVYTATLTVKSKYGCEVTTSHTFTVNGATPKAAFVTKTEVQNTFCSSDDVLFKDKSTVDFGIITKIEWYFDFNNHPNDVTVYTKDQFPADRIFHHNYGLLNSSPSQTYHVKMIVYSGGICQNPFEDDVTIYANPLIDVSPINPTNTICQEAPPVQIKATVLYGAGTGVFSGTGVTSDGMFDPAVSGPGTFTINYLFTTDITKCTYGSSQQITVYPTPKADAGPALHMLQGGNITINATASGVQPLTYKWTLANGSKAIGLDHDDVLTPVASPNDDITYMLTVTSADGCSASSNVDITVLKAPVVPNTFTPNSDGVNDRWEIKYLDTYPNCSIEIYNRYGEKLYSSIGYPLPWDGTYKGAALPVGTYYYIINPKNGRKVITGSVTIIR